MDIPKSLIESDVLFGATRDKGLIVEQVRDGLTPLHVMREMRDNLFDCVLSEGELYLVLNQLDSMDFRLPH